VLQNIHHHPTHLASRNVRYRSPAALSFYLYPWFELSRLFTFTGGPRVSYSVFPIPLVCFRYYWLAVPVALFRSHLHMCLLTLSEVRISCMWWSLRLAASSAFLSSACYSSCGEVLSGSDSVVTIFNSHFASSFFLHLTKAKFFRFITINLWYCME